MAEEFDVIKVIFPFTKGEYFAHNEEGREKLLREMVRLNMGVLPDFEWGSFREHFDQHAPGIATCPHQAMAMKLAVQLEDKDREIAQLRERMEDLCAEMERVRKGEGRLLIFGPGASEEKASA